LNLPSSPVRIKDATPRAFRGTARIVEPSRRFAGQWSSAAVKVVPLGDNVVIRRIDPPQASLSGIVLPEGVPESTQHGRVLSVGDGHWLADGSRAPHQVREGDRVLFANYAGIEVAVSGEKLLIMSEDEILAIVP
jgi:chaperonin GroES